MTIRFDRPHSDDPTAELGFTIKEIMRRKLAEGTMTSERFEYQQFLPMMAAIGPTSTNRGSAASSVSVTTQTGPSVALYEALKSESELKLEFEGLKSHLISLQRELNSTRRNESFLKTQNLKLTETNSELTKALRAVQDALIGRDAQELCMHASHSGVVNETAGDEVAVVFDTEDGELEQVYQREQFFQKELPHTGDRLQAHVFVTRRADESDLQEAQDEENEFSGFRTKRIKGPIEL